jgi:hypothetical protein
LPSESPPAEDLVVSQRRDKDQVRWVCRIGAPFAQLIIGGAKVLETRVDFISNPQHLPRLKPGTRVLVYYDENYFPPRASAHQKEQTEVDIQCAASPCAAGRFGPALLRAPLAVWPRAARVGRGGGDSEGKGGKYTGQP